VEEVCRFGLTEANMKDIGKTIRPTVVEDCFTLTVMFLRDVGSMTKLKVGDGMYIKMAPNMMANGKTTNNMVEAKKSGLTDHPT